MNEPASQFPSMHLVGVSIVYAIGIFLSCYVADVTLGFTFVMAFAILLPLLVIFGAWAAIGPGLFLKRVAAFTMSGPLLILVGALGLYLSAPRTFFPGQMSIARSCVIAVLISIPVCVATQIPYWVFRTLFGWQFVLEHSDWEEKKFSLREMFLLTAVFAIAFAAPRFATDLIVDSIASNNVQIEEAESGRLGVPVAVIVYSAIVALFSLFFAPAIWFCLRKGNSVKGVWVASLFLFVSLFGIGCLIAFFTIGFRIPMFVISYLFCFPIVFTAAGIIPLLVSRRRGIRLVIRRDCREKAAQQS